MPGIVLMENAGRGCAEFLLAQSRPQNVVICCGPGNNGGDGYVIARHLENHGVATKVVLCCAAAKISGDALINYRIHSKSNGHLVQVGEQWGAADFETVLSDVDGTVTEVIVDCLLGTGSQGNPRNPIDGIIRAANGLTVQRVAIDLPSGLDCDTGQPGIPTFVADMTCTFVAQKTGFKTETAKKYLGRIHVVDIGIPKCVLEQLPYNAT